MNSGALQQQHHITTIGADYYARKTQELFVDTLQQQHHITTTGAEYYARKTQELFVDTSLAENFTGRQSTLLPTNFCEDTTTSAWHSSTA